MERGHSNQKSNYVKLSSRMLKAAAMNGYGHHGQSMAVHGSPGSVAVVLLKPILLGSTSLLQDLAGKC